MRTRQPSVSLTPAPTLSWKWGLRQGSASYSRCYDRAGPTKASTCVMTSCRLRWASCVLYHRCRWRTRPVCQRWVWTLSIKWAASSRVWACHTPALIPTANNSPQSWCWHWLLSVGLYVTCWSGFRWPCVLPRLGPTPRLVAAPRMARLVAAPRMARLVAALCMATLCAPSSMKCSSRYSNRWYILRYVTLLALLYRQNTNPSH